MSATIARIEKTEFENLKAVLVCLSLTSKQGLNGWKGCELRKYK